VRETLLALIFFLAWLEQPCSRQMRWPCAQGQIKLAPQAGGAERAQLLTQSQDLLRRNLQGVTARRAAMLLQTRAAVLLIAPPPPADRERAGGDQPSSDLPLPRLA
jgi:hypothetical protein